MRISEVRRASPFHGLEWSGRRGGQAGGTVRLMGERGASGASGARRLGAEEVVCLGRADNQHTTRCISRSLAAGCAGASAACPGGTNNAASAQRRTTTCARWPDRWAEGLPAHLLSGCWKRGAARRWCGGGRAMVLYSGKQGEWVGDAVEARASQVGGRWYASPERPPGLLSEAVGNAHPRIQAWRGPHRRVGKPPFVTGKNP